MDTSAVAELLLLICALVMVILSLAKVKQLRQQLEDVWKQNKELAGALSAADWELDGLKDDLDDAIELLKDRDVNALPGGPDM